MRKLPTLNNVKVLQTYFQEDYNIIQTVIKLENVLERLLVRQELTRAKPFLESGRISIDGTQYEILPTDCNMALGFTQWKKNYNA